MNAPQVEIPERARAWAWWVFYAAIAAAGVALVVGVGVLAVLNLGALAGVPVALVLAVLGVGTAAWWTDGRERP